MEGFEAATQQAIELGAYFSVNAAGLRRETAIDLIPLDRLLLETDHPDGDRSAPVPRKPGRIDNVETALADRLPLDHWRNLKGLINDVGCR